MSKRFGYDAQGRITFNGEPYRATSLGSTPEGLERAARFSEWLSQCVSPDATEPLPEPISLEPSTPDPTPDVMDDESYWQDPDHNPYLLTGPELSRAIAARLRGYKP